MSTELFGHMPDGAPVHRVRISGGGLSASILDYGALVQDLRLVGHAPPLVLGFERFEDYISRSPYFGAIAGRYANRIEDGRFTLDGRQVQLDRNFLGKHLLHGGSNGTGKRLWRIAEAGESHVRLHLRDRDGEMGFPGNLDIDCTYRLEAPGTLAIELEARTDAPTLCNLAHHSYFNLEDGGWGDILGHRVRIAAETYLPVDEEDIPLDGPAPVAQTAFDFRTLRAIRCDVGGDQVHYDHNWCLAPARREPVEVARVEAPSSGLAMTVSTTEPGLQFYAGHKLAINGGGLEGRSYGPFAGFCMEAQVWPDAPNRPGFPSAVLRPGETYRQCTAYRFLRPAQE